MKLIATHNDPHVDPQVGGQAVAALTALGFSNIRLEIGVAARPPLRLAPGDDSFDTIVCPGGAEGVRSYFYLKNKWRWVRVDPRKVDGVKYVAIYETVLDAENNNAPGGRGQVIAYAPVLGYEVATSGPHEGKYCFALGDIETLDRPIPAGDLHLRNIRYTKLVILLEASTLEEHFRR